MLLRTRLIVAAVGAIAVIATSLIVAAYRVHAETEMRLRDTALRGKHTLWSETVEGTIEKMQGAIESLTRNRTLLLALQRNDGAAVDDAIRTNFRRLTASEVLTDIQVVNADGVALFSEPHRYVDKTRMRLVATALGEKRIAGGIERDGGGRLLAVLAFPLYVRSERVGAGVFMRALDDAVSRFGDASANAAFVTADGSALYSSDDALYSRIAPQLSELPSPATGYVAGDSRVFYVTKQPLHDAFGKAVAEIVTATDATKSHQQQQRVLFGAAAGGLALVILVIWGLYRYISRAFGSFDELTELMQAIAEGDLTGRVNGHSADEVGRLLGGADAMAERLRELLSNIARSAAELGEARQALTGAAEHSQSRMQALLADTGEVAASVTQMAASVQEVAGNAAQTATATHQAGEQTTRGVQVVRDTKSAVDRLAAEVEQASAVMRDLGKDAEDVGGILDVIRAVAEQTNLLALNAAIEAARAGEQGRGFAVVADEVRALSERTQRSIEQIREVIERVQSRARSAIDAMQVSREHAAENVERAAALQEMLSAIGVAVGAINDMNTQVAASTEQQSAVAEEISTKIHAINTAAERTTDVARETAAICLTVERHATQLNGLVAAFQV